jgi:hypothetical protein
MLDRPHVDLCLAAACDPMQQQDREPLLVQQTDNLTQGLQLMLVQFDKGLALGAGRLNA